MNLEEALEAIDKIEANALRAGNPDLVLCWGVHRWGHEIAMTARAGEAREIVTAWLAPFYAMEAGAPRFVDVFVQTGRVQVDYNTRRLKDWVGIDNATNRFAPISYWTRYFGGLGFEAEYVEPDYDKIAAQRANLYDGDEP